jgi:glycosyltransferase involved in cell wall biosynthesis
MKISIVIPVYNEGAQLRACLQAIERQTVRPYEVIVVDNNSSDNSLAIAQSFDFVTALKETKQGVVHARTTGFNKARGDVIARIDADTLLPAGWLAQISSNFRDPALSAISGAPDYYDFGWAGLANVIDWKLRARLARKLGANNFLWGANMALRRSAWQQVRDSLCVCSGIHEDFDLAIHLQARGLKVAYSASLVAGVSSRRIDTSFAAYARYTLVSPRTYARHNLTSRRHMYPVLVVCWLCYVPGRMIYRAYNPETGTFSLAQLLAVSKTRVDPTANVA